MSTQRSSSGGSKISEDEINHLISKLQELLPQLNRRRIRNRKVSASKVLKETCSYIRRLHSQVDGLSERLSQLLNSMGVSSVDDILQL